MIENKQNLQACTPGVLYFEGLLMYEYNANVPNIN